MQVRYVQKGNNLNYENKTSKTIPANTVVVIGNRVGIAGFDIEPGQLGSLIVDGCYTAAKSTEEKIDFGTQLYYDTSNDVVTATKGTNVAMGFAASEAAASDTEVMVKINA